MRIFESIEEFTQPRQPLALGIGNFDGVHRGHRAVIQKVQASAGKEGQSAILTFKNHPSEVLRPEQPTPLLCTLAHKVRLIQNFGVDDLIILPFTRHLAQHSAASFIERLHQFIPFSHLILGHDGTLGRDRQGNQSTMHALGDQWGFTVHYFEAYRFEGKPVSSTLIRELVQKGDLEQVEKLLDRPFSIYGTVIQGQGKGKLLGYPTANLDVAGLCLPPFGVYAVEVLWGTQRLSGIANLGIAPTIRTAPTPILEVHLFDSEQELYGEAIEVIFTKFIRPEQKFQSPEELQQQIAHDIQIVKQLCPFH